MAKKWLDLWKRTLEWRARQYKLSLVLDLVFLFILMIIALVCF